MNELGFPILSLMMAVPMAGAHACACSLRRRRPAGSRWSPRWSIWCLGICCGLNFDQSGGPCAVAVSGICADLRPLRLGAGDRRHRADADRIDRVPDADLHSVASWDAIEKRVGEYMAAFLFMETLMIGVFAAQDLFLFYIFFEAGLIPMYLIIGIWGGVNRIYASYKFFLYTLLGSVLMLIAMMWMVREAGTTDIPTADGLQISIRKVQTWLWLAFFASFAVKMPMWPVHTWLPDAHVQAPTAGSVILAGVLLKMGGYGFIRFSLPMFPEASAQFAWLVLGPVDGRGGLYLAGRAGAERHEEADRLFSSVAHMAIVTVGLFAFNQAGIEGAMMVMLGHGLVSGALFLCVGVIYDRLHTREIDRYGGLSINMPKYALLFMLFTMASVGLPGTANFVGEFLCADGRLSGVDLGRADRDHRHHPRRGLYALSLSPHLLRRAEERRCRCDAGSGARASWCCSFPIGCFRCCGWASIPKASLRPCAPTSQAIVARMAPRCRRRVTAKLTGQAPSARRIA
jgi:NADH-quinone oxidoreductase subunit M